MAEFIKLRVRDRIATLTLDRPALHNAFNEEVMGELIEAFTSLAESEGDRVIVLAAEGKSFCAGADVNWMKRMVDFSVAENIADANLLARMLRAIRECPKPVIARIHGAAIGGGVGLVAACDIAVAVEAAVFSLSEVKLGIVPAVISPFVMEKIGAGHLRRFGLTAERFDAREAHRIGLISHVVADEGGMDAWIAQTCDALKANGPRALAACKKILSEVAGRSWDETQRLTAERIAALRISPEGQEGLKSFLEKRKPPWT